MVFISEISNFSIEPSDELVNPYRVVLELPFEHSLMKRATGKAGRKMFEMTGGGIGIIDYDRDGQLDLFLTQGGETPADRSQAACDCLLRRSSSGFQEVTLFAGIQDSLYGQGVSVGPEF